ncbi:MAG TPA: class I SAM-dependent methyltransferase [Chloroflexota bacterium]|nr:class I SAM-dependent methyltransferase [Chloroflexota bacterium]
MSADPPPQNIYDDPAFFAGYSRLERFGAGWTTAFELPSLLSLLPDVTGRRVLDLGCGAGQLARYVAERGAAEVIGVDLSETMLAPARAEWSHPRVTHVRASIEEVTFPAERFDLVVSSFAFHYVADYHGLCQRIAEWLVASGVLVFSTEHPVYLSRATAEGWVRDAEGRPLYWALDRYGEEGLREEHWIVDGVQKYHRLQATLLNGLIDAGLRIERVLEPMPDEAMLRRHPDWVYERKRPFCLLVRARKG